MKERLWVLKYFNKAKGKNCKIRYFGLESEYCSKI